jgi:hypothetical protein
MGGGMVVEGLEREVGRSNLHGGRGILWCKKLLFPIDSTKCKNKFGLTLHPWHKLYLVEKSLPSANSVTFQHILCIPAMQTSITRKNPPKMINTNRIRHIKDTFTLHARNHTYKLPCLDSVLAEIQAMPWASYPPVVLPWNSADVSMN